MVKILIGLIILSIMVFIHELGHFIAAKLCGVVVESFSIGWGPVLFKKKKGDTEYRISAIPMGGYCGMKGEKAFQQAIEENLPAIPKKEGELYGVHPFKRIIIAFAGPFANYISAVLALAIVSAIGSSYYTSSNKIAPVYYYNEADDSPAREADLRMGDVILSINSEKTETFADIVRLIVPEAKEEVTLEIEREGQILTKKLRPKLDPKTGAGIIGFYSFIPLEIDGVKPSSSAELAGLKKGDLITEVNGIEVANTVDLNRALDGISGKTAELGILRDGNKITKTVNLIRTENGIDLGLNIKNIKVEIPGTGIFKSIVNGFVLTHKAFILTFKSLGLLFKGVDFRQAVSGPVRITHMLGDVAAQGFKAGFLIGLSDILNFVSIISISLFIMNLLPIPILDGGLILFAFIEFIFRRQIHPKVLYYVQFIGIAFIGIVFIFALWGDIGYFLGR
ncbi:MULTISPECIES: RIP metalloprotease RseP [Treponema]|uniref:Zinc metalloprotease n=1 Tax=Treponema denticola (strain ATCC 35405 / DSM 14222 / CIP 103919 / JCM 8153 / KCTC 15104) TaxID=243275 RepID=Q73K79_TREDE|nr:MULTISPECIES: RIP metalloprotease RseP [Treponema]AAS12859.1 membrane-associated zinc metalloprotease, putative [Treponema denticola ATCC 35405]EMB38195.1 RIP metalloprotease RseP [Treponema denticola ATCC 35404]EMB40151.1 RIP metalloprotease RseP [Treponema denticola ATCC 33521]HCY95308.1 RIP metalloprotease RseP [Treponema sp.]